MEPVSQGSHSDEDAKALGNLRATVVFELDEDAWNEFQAMLNAPPRDMPAMRKLLNEPSVLEL